MATQTVPETPRPTLAQIQEFLKEKRVALVGVSRNPKDFTRQLFNEFARRGYDVVPVHPEVSEIEGRPCVASVRDLPSVSAVLILTSPGVTERIVADCIAAGVKHVWMYRAGGAGSVNADGVNACRAHGINVIAGECPYMFFPASGFPHNIHGFIKKIFHAYPA